MQDLNDKITGNTLTAAEWNEVPSEIQNVITGLGIALSGGDLNQLGKAIAGYVANGDFYTDSGAADGYVLSVVGSKQAPTAYTDGMKIRFVAANPNTGAAVTVNVAGLGVKSVTDLAGAAPSAGAITADTEAVYKAGAGRFEVEVTETAGISKAWVNLDGVVFGARSQYNISGLSKNGTGDYRISSTAITANSCITATAGDGTNIRIAAVSSIGAGTCDIRTADTAGVVQDVTHVMVVVHNF